MKYLILALSILSFNAIADNKQIIENNVNEVITKAKEVSPWLTPQELENIKKYRFDLETNLLEKRHLSHYKKETLNSPTVINGIKFPPGSRIISRDFTTKKITRISSPKIIEFNGIYFDGSNLLLDNKHGIKSGSLAFPQKINGIYYGKPHTEFKLHDNGIVANAMLFKPTIIDGIKLKKDSFLYLYKDGSLESGRLYEDTTVYGIKINAGQFIKFKNIDKSLNIYITDNMVVDGYHLKNYSFYKEILVYPNGKLKYGLLAKQAIINNILYPEYTLLYLNKDGTVKSSFQVEKPAEKIKEGDTFTIPQTSIVLHGEVIDFTDIEYKHPSLISVSNSLNLGIDMIDNNLTVSKILKKNSTIIAIKQLDKYNWLFKDQNGTIFRQYVFNNKPSFYINECSRSFNKCTEWNKLLENCQNKKCIATLVLWEKTNDGFLVTDAKDITAEIINNSKKEIIPLLNKYNIEFNDVESSNYLYVKVNSLQAAILAAHHDYILYKDIYAEIK